MSKYDDLVKKLKEIFQIDRPELDFGIYRIFNARAAEINHYLEHRLKTKANESLAASGAANLDGLQRELAEKETQYRADGIDPATVPKVLEIKQKLAQYSTGASEHENAVFSHLLTFFSRYYDKGDFISQRRYKGDTYAIPYAGEEVVLHWANKDQYYIKSSESFSNYAFKLDDGRAVRFRLVTADTAKDNRKDNDKERRFVLIEKHTRILTDEEGDEIEEELLPVTEENGANGQELVLRFEYSAGAYAERTIDLVETFNYLIGLRVKHIDMQREQGFVTITGWLPSGEKTLVLWRDMELVDYEQLNRLCGKLAINPADSEFDVVYINGGHNISAVFTSTEAEGGITKTLKIRQIEAEFLSRMFAVDGAS